MLTAGIHEVNQISGHSGIAAVDNVLRHASSIIGEPCMRVSELSSTPFEGVAARSPGWGGEAVMQTLGVIGC